MWTQFWSFFGPKENFREKHGWYNKPSEFSYGRRCGNSTRLADYYIQRLFIDGKIKVEDHYHTRQASDFLFTTIKRRLEFEHQGVIPSLEFNRGQLTIIFIKPTDNA
jgi:hypothetical protein